MTVNPLGERVSAVGAGSAVRAVGVGSVFMLLAGCGSEDKPVTQLVTIHTPDVASARCLLYDVEGRETVIAGTPGQVRIDRRGGPYDVSCTAPGYAPASLKLVGIETGASGGLPLFPSQVVVTMQLVDPSATPVAIQPAHAAGGLGFGWPKPAIGADAIQSGRTALPRVAAAKPSPPQPGAYSIQVGAFRRRANAKRLAERLLGHGYDTRLVPGPDLTRVRIGHYATRAEATMAARRFKREHGAAAFSVRN